MLSIKKILARQILDSRGNPTIETQLSLSDGSYVLSSVPSGASVGENEAVELRDGDPDLYGGKGVEKAVSGINTEIAQSLTGKSVTSQKEADETLIALDGTGNKSRLGANATLAVSIAVSKAGALASHKPLYKYLSETCGNSQLSMPKLLVNLINGGLHAGRNLEMQEFMVIPKNAPSVKTALSEAYAVNQNLRKVLVELGSSPLVGDEGGLAPSLESNEDALALLEKVTKSANLTLGNDIFLGIDAAADNFRGEDGFYQIRDFKSPISTEELAAYYKALLERYPLAYLEDPFAENDSSGWEKLMHETDESLTITGDDLTVTNPNLLKTALEKNLIRGIIIKPNQIGTVTEAMQTAAAAKKAGLLVTVSHRSGETNDSFIADFAIGIGAYFVKFGAPVRGERVAKYNRLLKIEEELS